MKRAAAVQLSREEGEAVRARLEANTLTAEDRRVLGKGLTDYFWLLFALRGATLSLKRLKALVCGETPTPPPPPVSGGTTGGGSGSRREPQTSAAQEVPSSAAPSPSEQQPPPPGHGRQGAEVYRAAQTVEGRHEEFAVGQRWPACGRGRWYR
jgi:hypothetical protein